VWAATASLVVHTSTAFTPRQRQRQSQQPFHHAAHHQSDKHASVTARSVISPVSVASSVAAAAAAAAQGSRLYAMNDKDKEALTSTTTTDNNVDTATFDKALQEGKLRQAVQYLQDHPDMPVSRQRFNDIFAAIEERTAVADEAAMTAQKEAQRASPEQFQPAVEFQQPPACHPAA
jgi:hypothetical protein